MKQLDVLTLQSAVTGSAAAFHSRSRLQLHPRGIFISVGYSTYHCLPRSGQHA